MCDSGQYQERGCCEDGNEPPGSIECRRFLCQLQNCQLVEGTVAPCRWSVNELVPEYTSLNQSLFFRFACVKINHVSNIDLVMGVTVCQEKQRQTESGTRSAADLLPLKDNIAICSQQREAIVLCNVFMAS